MNTPYDEFPKRKVAVYIRVSTQEQKIDGYGLESQERKLLSYINDNKALNLITKPEWIFKDVHTGSELQRQGLQKLLRAVELKKFDAVIVWKIDRLSRSLKHLLEIFEKFQKYQVSFISIQENIDFNGPIGNLIFQIFGSIAQFERELIKTRTLAGKITSAEMGNYTGSKIPYGYEPVPNKSGKGRRLELINEEKKVVEDIFHWYVYEDLGYKQIADRLNDFKIPKGKCSSGKNKYLPWSARHIEKIIPNPLYRGEFLANTKDEYGNQLPEDQWTVVAVPACVGEFLFSMAQQKRKERVGKTSAKDHIYLLSNKLIDVSVPERKKLYGIPRSKGGYSYRRLQYTSKDKSHYPVFEISASMLEEEIWAKLKFAMTNTKEFIKRYLAMEKLNKTYLDSRQEELTSLRERLMNTELETARIEKAYEQGVYSIEKMNAKMTEVSKKTSQIEQQILEIEDELKMISFKDREITNLHKTAEQVKYNIDNFSRKQKKMMIDICIDRIEVDRKEIPSNGVQKKWHRTVTVYFRFDPERISSDLGDGRTRKHLNKAEKRDSKPKNGSSGVQGGRSCTFFTCEYQVKNVLEMNLNKVIYKTSLEEVSNDLSSL